MFTRRELLMAVAGAAVSLAGAGIMSAAAPLPQASNQMHGIRNVGDGPATYHVIRWNSPGMLKR